jgi:hypothetical protein
MTRGAVLLKPEIAFIHLQERNELGDDYTPVYFTITCLLRGGPPYTDETERTTPRFSGLKGTSWNKYGFSLDQILLF